MLSDAFQLVGTTIVGKYRVDRVLGEGGFGVVYAGHHLIVGERVAIKCVKVTGGSPGDAERATASFLREARALFSLTHPAIVRMYDVGAIQSPFAPVPYVVLELVDGVSLEEELARRVRERAPFSASEILLVLVPVLEALAFAHERGIAHRDLKPSNVMLVRPPGGSITAKVLDFGMASLGTATAAATASAGAVGFTPGYAAPEQWDPSRGPAGPASDTFALGLLLAEMCTLEQVLDGDGVGQIFAATMAGPGDLRIAARRPDLPPDVERVAARAVRIAPHERYPTAREMLEDLRLAFGNTVAHARTDAPPALAALAAPPPRVLVTQAPPAPSVAPLLTGVLAMVVAMAVLAIVGALLLGQHRPVAAPAQPLAAPSDSGPLVVTPAPRDDPAAASAPPASPGSAARPRSPTVHTARIVGAGLGELEERACRTVVEAHLSELSRCYADALAHEPTLHGEASFMIDTAADGAVTKLMIGGGPPVATDPVLRPCLMGVGHRLRFPAAKKASFIYVLAFGT